MSGTTPRFYKIPVTKDLVDGVRHGIYPSQPMRVSVCYPPVRWSEGVGPLENRREIFRCFGAFKDVIGIR